MTRAMRYLPPACAAVTGVLEIAFDPSFLRRGRRVCRQCQLAYNARRNRALTAARHLLGMTRETYLSTFGGSRAVAERILAGADHASE